MTLAATRGFGGIMGVGTCGAGTKGQPGYVTGNRAGGSTRPRIRVRAALGTLRVVALEFGVVAVLWFASYRLAPGVGILVYLLAIGAFAASHNEVFWLAVFFAVIQSPGYFFTNQLPLLSFGAHASFDPRDLFIIAFVLKAMASHLGRPSLFRRPMYAVFAGIAFSFVFSIVAYPFDPGAAVSFVRPYFYYCLLLAFPFLINREEQVVLLIKLLMPWTFFIVANQIYCLAAGGELINELLPETRASATFLLDSSVRPIPGGHLILVISFILALSLLAAKHPAFTAPFLWLVSGTSYLGVILSGTRSWAFIFSLIAVLVALTSGRALWRLVVAATMLFAFTFVVDQARPEYRKRIAPAVQRIGELEIATSGEIRSIDTADDRMNGLEAVLGAIQESPILGWGVSTVGLETFNNDLGFVNTILLVGVVGFSCFVVFVWSVVSRLRAGARRASRLGTRNQAAFLRAMLAGWIGLLVGYLTIHDLFIWYFQNISFIALFIAICDFYLKGVRVSPAHLTARSASRQTLVASAGLHAQSGLAG